MNTLGISIIICVHNGALRIAPTLKAISEQNLPLGISVELLIIDNASTDSTASFANEYWNILNTPFPLKIIEEQKPGKANALITGYNAANYELMLLCDDDNWLQPDYLKTVIELFSKYPDIGLLGGYGKAVFNGNEKPDWFDKWENCFVCGKHHSKNGFLQSSDFSIWGAGSVIRKTMWDFLLINGFSFYNSVDAGKPMTEDAELSMAITFTGHRLYFNDNLWFMHDFRDGRINRKTFIKQQALNGKGNAILYMYLLAYENCKKGKIPVRWLTLIRIAALSLRYFRSLLKPFNYPNQIYLFNIIKELIVNFSTYSGKAKESSVWIKKIKHTYPLAKIKT